MERGYTHIYTGFYHEKNGTTHPVVFKCLDVAQVPDWATLQHLQHEAELLKGLSHPRLPAFFECKELMHHDTRYTCLIQAHMPGENLSQKLEQHLTLPPAEVLDILVQALTLLNILHQQQPPLMHLDIKPSNFLQDDQKQCYLIDFGAALRLGEEAFSLVGTPGFSPPEQLSGRAVPASDLYALGATALVLLTGSPAEAFFDGHRLDFWEQIPHLAPAYKSWLEIMLHPDVSLRFDDAAQALSHLLKQVASEDAALHTALQASIDAIPDAVLAVHGSTAATQWSAHAESQLKPTLEGYTFEHCQSPPLQRISETWWATRDLDALPVVIKKLNVALLSDWQALIAFEREIENLSQLKHPAFPGLLAVEKTASAWFLVQHRLPGVSLIKHLASGWQPDAIALSHWILALLDILRVLHAQHPPLIHRDLQPEHILMDGDTPYLLGFGGAQQRFVTPGSGGSTQTGSFGFTAPEQYMGLHSPRSDIFSVGMCAIYILRRRSPATYHWENNTLQLEDLSLPEGLKAWLRRVTHLDPEQRHRSAEDAYVALKHQHEELKAAAVRLSDSERQQLRLKKLRQAESQYAQKSRHFAQGQPSLSCQENPWTKTLQAAQIPAPPTLRINLTGVPERHLNLEILGPTQTREPRLKQVSHLLKLALWPSALLLLGGLLFSTPVICVPLVLNLMGLWWLRHHMRSVQHTQLYFESASEQGRSQRQNNTAWGKQGALPDQVFVWHTTPTVHVEQSARPWCFSPTYYTLLINDQPVASDVYLLDSEKAWLSENLPRCLAQLGQSSATT